MFGTFLSSSLGLAAFSRGQRRKFFQASNYCVISMKPLIFQGIEMFPSVVSNARMFIKQKEIVTQVHSV